MCTSLHISFHFNLLLLSVHYNHRNFPLVDALQNAMHKINVKDGFYLMFVSLKLVRYCCV